MLTNSVESLAARLSQLAWPMFWQLSVVILCVALLTRLFCRNRPHLASVLWLLVVVKALTPPLWSSPTSVFSWAAAQYEVAATGQMANANLVPLTFQEPSTIATAQPADVAPGKPDSAAIRSARLSLTGWLAFGWMAGVACMSAMVLVQHLRIRSRIRATAVPAGSELHALVEGLRASLGVRRRVRLIVVDESIGPALIGVLRPAIVIPRSLTAHSERELAPILAHELIHLRRGDTLAALLQVAAQVAWWFHPLMYWANREMRRQRELACDAEVLAALHCPGRDYAHSLLLVLEGRMGTQPAAIWPGIYRADVTATRIRRIASDVVSRSARTPRWCWGLFALLLLITVPGAGLLLPAQEQQAADEGKQARTADAEVVFELATGEINGIWVPDQQEVAPSGITVPLAPDALANERFAEIAQAYEQLATPEIREAVATITDHGGRVTFFTRSPELIGGASIDSPAPYFSVQLDVAWKGDAGDVKRLARLKPLRMLQLRLDNAPQAALAELAPLGATLQTLTLVGVGDEGMAQLAKLPALRQLGIYRGLETLTDQGLKHLAKTPALQRLELIQTELSDTNLAALTELRQLESLHLVGDEQPGPELDMPWLAGLEKLRRLTLLLIRPTPAALDRIASLTKLRQLWFDASLLDDESFARLGALQEQRDLTVTQAGHIGPRGWGSLAECQQLSRLLAYDPGLSEAAVVAVGSIKSLRMLQLADTTVGAAGLAAIGGLTNLRYLHVNATADDRDFAPLASLHQLETLQLSAKELGDEACRPIGELENLSTLSLFGTKIGAEGFAHLAKLTRLRNLSLTGTPYSGTFMADPQNPRRINAFAASGTLVLDDALKPFRSLTALDSLHIAGAVVTDNALAPLVGLENLKSLSLHKSLISGGALAELGRMTQLVTLNLAGTNVIDDDLQDLAPLANLRSLDLSNTKITDAGLMQLAPLKSLRDLTLRNSQVTDEGFKALREKLPDIHRHNVHWSLQLMPDTFGFELGEEPDAATE